MGMSEKTARQPAPFQTWLKLFASPAVLFFLLPWLMILLTLGTVAQKEMGIFAAQKMFFSSWILWLGPLPLPGSYTTLGIMTLCLAAKFLLYSPWRLERAGTIISHLGVLVLLIGGIITAFSQQEGYLSLREGQSGNVISDYYERALIIQKDGKDYKAIPFADLSAGSKINTGLPFTATVNAICENCKPVPVRKPEKRQGLAQQMDLFPAPLEKENEINMAGVTLELSGISDEQDGYYITLEEVPHKPAVTMGGAKYSFSMERKQQPLPFSIELVDFKRDVHPGTDMASGFSSDVVVHDDGVEWPYHIRMNEPLRYKGYTFYQASFSERPDGEYSVLSIVQNKGRAFPYLASALIFLGLLLHVVLRLKQGRRT